MDEFQSLIISAFIFQIQLIGHCELNSELKNYKFYLSMRLGETFVQGYLNYLRYSNSISKSEIKQTWDGIKKVDSTRRILNSLQSNTKCLSWEY